MNKKGIKPMSSIRMFRSPEAIEFRDVGEKAASIAAMKQSGMWIPDGFVMTPEVCHAFIDQSAVAVRAIEALARAGDGARERAARQVAESLGALSLPEVFYGNIVAAIDRLDRDGAFAMRSSGVGGAGNKYRHATILNARGLPSILSGIRSAFLSFWEPEAIIGRREAGLDPVHPAVATIVQRMMRFEASGLAFPFNPDGRNLNEIVVCGRPGLGGRSGVQVGEGDDRWIMDGHGLAIKEELIVRKGSKMAAGLDGVIEVGLDPAMGERTSLPAAKVFEVAAMVVAIKSRYDSPKVVRWGLADGRVWALSVLDA